MEVREVLISFCLFCNRSPGSAGTTVRGSGEMGRRRAYGAIGTTFDVAIKIGRQAGYLNL